MKKFLLCIVAVMMTALFSISCGNQSGKTEEKEVSENVTKTEAEVIESVNDDAAVKDFLTTLYNNYVFEYKDFSAIKQHFAPNVLKRLKDGYDYDGEGYAVWLFRTGAQDGPSDVSKVNSIEKDSDGWYVVKYTDMGIEGTCRFLVEQHNSEVIVLDFKCND